MSYISDISIDTAEIEYFVEAMRGENDDGPSYTNSHHIGEQSRILPDNNRIMQEIWGDLYKYDETRNVFIPHWLSAMQTHVVEPVAATPSEPVGYHNLTAADL